MGVIYLIIYKKSSDSIIDFSLCQSLWDSFQQNIKLLGYKTYKWAITVY